MNNKIIVRGLAHTKAINNYKKEGLIGLQEIHNLHLGRYNVIRFKILAVKWLYELNICIIYIMLLFNMCFYYNFVVI